MADVTPETTKEPQSTFCKLCLPGCAVYQAEGCKCPNLCLAMYCGCWYTMFCWEDPGKPKEPAGTPENKEMER